MATQNKNVRLGVGALEVLRSLKYDLDASDGAIMEQALHARAFERLREHVEDLDRIDRGLPADGGRDEHAAAAQVLLTALNRDGKRLRLTEGHLQTAGDGADRWYPVGTGVDAPPLVRQCWQAAVAEVRELGCFCVDLEEALLSLTRPATPGHAVLQALGVDLASLRAALLPLAARGDLLSDRHFSQVPFGARAHEAIFVETPAEALRLGHARVQPEHLVLAVLRAARGPLLSALESHAATYHLMRLRLTTRPALLPWTPDLVQVLVRAHALARLAHRADLYPNLLMLALAERGAAATPGVDGAALRPALEDTELCRRAAAPLPLSLQVAIGWNLGSSLMVADALRSASALARDAGRPQIEPADVFAALCQVLEQGPVKSDVSLQQTSAALTQAGWRPVNPAADQ